MGNAVGRLYAALDSTRRSRTTDLLRPESRYLDQLRRITEGRLACGLNTPPLRRTGLITRILNSRDARGSFIGASISVNTIALLFRLRRHNRGGLLPTATERKEGEGTGIYHEGTRIYPPPHLLAPARTSRARVAARPRILFDLQFERVPREGRGETRSLLRERETLYICYTRARARASWNGGRKDELKVAAVSCVPG